MSAGGFSASCSRTPPAPALCGRRCALPLRGRAGPGPRGEAGRRPRGGRRRGQRGAFVCRRRSHPRPPPVGAGRQSGAAGRDGGKEGAAAAGAPGAGLGSARDGRGRVRRRDARRSEGKPRCRLSFPPPLSPPPRPPPPPPAAHCAPGKRRAAARPRAARRGAARGRVGTHTAEGARRPPLSARPRPAAPLPPRRLLLFIIGAGWEWETPLPTRSRAPTDSASAPCPPPLRSSPSSLKPEETLGSARAPAAARPDSPRARGRPRTVPKHGPGPRQRGPSPPPAGGAGEKVCPPAAPRRAPRAALTMISVWLRCSAAAGSASCGCLLGGGCLPPAPVFLARCSSVLW